MKTGERAHRAFTLLELLVIIAVVGILAASCLPVLARVRYETNRAQCASNLRQFTLACHIFGQENNDKLPAGGGTGAWAWDLPWAASNSLLSYGATRTSMYCPANPAQNNDGLWESFSPGNFRIIGYAVTFGGTVSATNQNATLTPQTITGGGPLPYPAPLAARRVLLADATISIGGNEANRIANNYTDIAGGYIVHHRTSHLEGTLPIGGNLGMLDGHVEWRGFQDMHIRTSTAPYFWW